MAALPSTLRLPTSSHPRLRPPWLPLPPKPLPLPLRISTSTPRLRSYKFPSKASIFSVLFFFLFFYFFIIELFFFWSFIFSSLFCLKLQELLHLVAMILRSVPTLRSMAHLGVFWVCLSFFFLFTCTGYLSFNTCAMLVVFFLLCQCSCDVQTMFFSSHLSSFSSFIRIFS